jgi:DNA-directed RNA polymerase subunit K/omega
MTKKNIKNVKKDDDYDEEIEESETNEDDINEESEIEDNEELLIEAETDNGGCIIDELIEENIDLENEDIEINNTVEYVDKKDRISSNRLTKYEMVRILGERTKQLTIGAKPLVKNYGNLSYEKIAEEEFKKNMIPFKIKRPLPNGKYEIWLIDELYKDHLLSLLE